VFDWLSRAKQGFDVS